MYSGCRKRIRKLDEKLPILATINFEFKILNKIFIKINFLQREDFNLQDRGEFSF